MTTLLTAAAALWSLWIVTCLILMITARPPGASFNGFRVIIPAELSTILDADELEAVRQHELGHRHHGHVWINFALNCVFAKPSSLRRWRQEREADDFAAQRVGPAALASAMRKLLVHYHGAPADAVLGYPVVDVWRLERLEGTLTR